MLLHLFLMSHIYEEKMVAMAAEELDNSTLMRLFHHSQPLRWLIA
jgi:hypothetical protein